MALCISGQSNSKWLDKEEDVDRFRMHPPSLRPDATQTWPNEIVTVTSFEWKERQLQKSHDTRASGSRTQPDGPQREQSHFLCAKQMVRLEVFFAWQVGSYRKMPIVLQHSFLYSNTFCNFGQCEPLGPHYGSTFST